MRKACSDCLWILSPTCEGLCRARAQYVVTSDKEGENCELEKHLPDTDILITTCAHSDLHAYPQLCRHLMVRTKVVHARQRPSVRTRDNLRLHTMRAQGLLRLSTALRLVHALLRR